MKKLTALLFLLLAAPLSAEQTNLPSAYSKSTFTADFLPLDTTITVASTGTSWFALVNLVAYNTTSAIQTVTITLRHSLITVPDETITVSLSPGTSTVQLPKQFQGTDLGLGSHTFRVRVNQSTNSPIIYQTTSYLGIYNNTGTGGIVATGDVSGPGSSIDDGLVCWDGVAGDTVKDCNLGLWTVDGSGNLIASAGNLGINEPSPVARLHITDTSVLASVAARYDCGGAKTASNTCNQWVDGSTSSTNSIFKIAQSVSSAGAWTGTGAQAVGTFYDISGGTTNQAVYAHAGDIVLNSGKISNAADTTPDAYLDIATADATAGILATATSTGNAISVSATGAVAAGYVGVDIADAKTGGASGQLNIGQRIITNGVFSGSNVGLFVSATNGAEGNTAIAAFAGNIVAIAGDLITFDGQMSATNSTGDSALSANCGVGFVASSCVDLRSDALNNNDLVEVVGSGTNPFGMDIEITGDGTASAEGLSIDVTNTNATVQGITINADGEDGTGIQLNMAAEADTTLMTGTNLILDGNATAGAIIAHAVTVSDAEVPQAALFNCTQTVGGTATPCFELLTTGDGGGEFVGITSTVATGGGSATAIALATTTTGTTTSASSSVTIANAITSSTASINKVALDVSSTGTWDGSGAINAAVRASASGGTTNHAFWAETGGVRTPYVLYDPTATEPVACASGTEGWTAYDSDINLLCICSDSDGSSFEWESIENPATACFT